MCDFKLVRNMADNIVHRRRMREVVAFLERESQVEHQFTQSPEEHLFQISITTWHDRFLRAGEKC